MANIQNEGPSDNPTLSAALRYAKRGWHVFPVWGRVGDVCDCGDRNCKNQGKHPIADCAPSGFKSATTDEKTIKRWWRKYPKAGIGIATGKVSNLLVVDIDLKNGRNGLAALDQLFKTLGTPSKTKAAEAQIAL